MTLLAAIALLLLPAFVEGRLARWPAFAALLDGMMITAIAGLFGFFILPDALVDAGLWGGMALLAGAVSPMFAERLGVREKTVEGASALAGQLALLVHAALDGVSLAAATQGAPALAVSVLLHQVPVGLGVYSFQRTRFGVGAARLALLGMAAATALGFGLGEGWISRLDPVALGMLQAFGAGSVLHMLGHGALPGASGRPMVSGSGAMLVLGLFLLGPVLAPGRQHHPGEPEIAAHMWEGILRGAPWLLLGFLVLGLLRGGLPDLWRAPGLDRLSRLGVLGGVWLGLPSSSCACGTDAAWSRLRAAGAPPTLAMGFWLAAPALGLDGVLLGVGLMGPQWTTLRWVLVVILVVGVASVAGRVGSDRPEPHAPASASSWRPRPRGLPHALHGGLSALDHVAPWIVAGWLLTALAEGPLSDGGLRTIPAALQVPIVVMLGLPWRLSAALLTPLVVGLMAGGLSLGAAMALLLVGPSVSIGGIRRLHQEIGGAAAAVVGLGVVIMSVVAGWVVDVIWPSPGEIIPVEELGPGSWLAAGVLILLLLRSLLVRGPRAWLAHIGASPPEDGVESGRGHDHGHGHGIRHG